MKTTLIRLTSITLAITLTSCGTLTGIPSHGGGKRFATEQRLVSAAIRSSLKDIDVSPLRGKRVAVIFDIVADEGGGNLNGGRMNILGAATAGYLMSPITASSSAFQLFNLADAGSNYANTSNTGSNVAGTSFVTQNNAQNNSTFNNDSTSSQNTNSSNTDNTTASGTSQSTSNGSSNQTATGNTTNTSTTNGSSTSGTTTATYNQTDNSTGTSNQTVNGTSSDSSNGSYNSNTSTNSNGSSTTNANQTAIGSSSGTENSRQNGTSNQTGSSNDNGRQTGGYNSTRQEISQAPSYTSSQTRGHQKGLSATLDYKGLGDYSNFAVPKSDASLLMGLTRTYLLMNEVYATTPNDPTAEYLLYVAVDIFGIVRSRFDAYIYNQETLKAETSFEMVAFDRSGKMILTPRNSNSEAQYAERYLMWAGPYRTDEKVRKGKGLLVDFSDVKPGPHNRSKNVDMSYPFGKN